MTGPLQGFRVVEMGGIGPTPFAGGLLGDLGADVVRIDRVAGAGAEPDTQRRFDFYNRNKRSVALDLKKPAAVTTVLQLVTKADVLIEGFRPGVMERLGLGPEVCRKANPSLVYARMTGWGQTGPDRSGSGPRHQLSRAHRRAPFNRRCGPSASAAAQSGGGSRRRGALFGGRRACGGAGGAKVWTGPNDRRGDDRRRHASDVGIPGLPTAGVWTEKRADNIVDGGAPFYGNYATQDGKYVAVGAIEPQFYANLLSVMGLEPSNLPDQNDRRAWPRMRERFASVFRTRTRDEWIALAAGRDACLSPVLSIDEAPEHPQMRARNVYSAFDGLRHPSPAPQIRQNARHAGPRNAAPRPEQPRRSRRLGTGSRGDRRARCRRRDGPDLTQCA